MSKADKAPSEQDLLLASILPVESAWPVKVVVLTSHLAALFRKNGMHSVGAMGRFDDRYVFVPVVQWTNLRTVGDKVNVPTSIYADGPDGLYYQSWPVTSAIIYTVVEDNIFGAAIRIPFNEFKKVEGKAK